MKDAAVVGVPDARAGDLTRAYVVLQEGRNLNEEDINMHMKERLAPYKQLFGGIRVLESLPRNQLGKLSRKLLNELVTKENSDENII